MNIHKHTVALFVCIVFILLAFFIVTGQDDSQPDSSTVEKQSNDFWEGQKDQIVSTISASNEQQSNLLPESIAENPLLIDQQIEDISASIDNNKVVSNTNRSVTDPLFNDIVLSSSCATNARYITLPGIIPVTVEWSVIGNNIDSVEWRFDTGTTSSDKIVRLTYQTTGTYRVTLTCESPAGAILDTGSITISNAQTSGSFIITSTPLPSLTATFTRTPAATRTPTLTPTLGSTTPTSTNTKLPTATKTATNTPTAGPSPTNTPTNTKTPTLTATLVVSCEIEVEQDPTNLSEYTFSIKNGSISSQFSGRLPEHFIQVVVL